MAADIGEKVAAGDQERELSFSDSLPGIDREEIKTNLDKLLADLDQKSNRALERARTGE